MTDKRFNDPEKLLRRAERLGQSDDFVRLLENMLAGIQAETERLAYEKLEAARNELGDDFGGFSPVDLLLDNFLDMTMETARSIVATYEAFRRD